MKRTAIILTIIFATGAILQAQPKRNAVKADLFSLMISIVVLKYERAFNEDISAQLGFFLSKDSPTGRYQERFSGFGVTPEFRYYLLKKSDLNGVYLAPNFRYQKLREEDSEANLKATITNFSPAINLGIQVILKDIYLIDAWIRPSYNFRSTERTEPDISVTLETRDGFGFRIGVSVGLMF